MFTLHRSVVPKSLKLIDFSVKHVLSACLNIVIEHFCETSLYVCLMNFNSNSVQLFAASFLHSFLSKQTNLTMSPTNYVYIILIDFPFKES